MEDTKENFDKMEDELRNANWQQVGIGVWKAPSGLKYRGTFQSWRMMKAHPELQSPPIQQSV